MATFGATNYVWRSDIEKEVRRLADEVGVSVNNYEHHAQGMAPQLTSADFWALAGRGVHIPRRKARRVMRLVRRRAAKHPWRYMIYGRRGYLPDGSTFTPFGGAAWNAGHVHVSYW